MPERVGKHAAPFDATVLARLYLVAIGWEILNAPGARLVPNQPGPWQTVDLWPTLIMWAVMMMAMMLLFVGG